MLRKRFSWLDLTCIFLIWLAYQVTQAVTWWPWWLVSPAVFGGVCVIACISGAILRSQRGNKPHDR